MEGFRSGDARARAGGFISASASLRDRVIQISSFAETRISDLLGRQKAAELFTDTHMFSTATLPESPNNIYSSCKVSHCESRMGL